MVLRTKETPRFGGVINCVFDTWWWDNAYPTHLRTETAYVRKRLSVSPVVHDRSQAASRLFTLYLVERPLLSKDFLVFLLSLHLPFV